MLSERLNEAAKRGEVHQARSLSTLLAWRGLGVRRRKKLGALPVSQVRSEERAQTILKCGCAGVRIHVADGGGEDEAALRSRGRGSNAMVRGSRDWRATVGWSIPAEVLECQVFTMVVHADHTGTELDSNLTSTVMSTVLLAPSDVSSLPCSQQLTQSRTHQSSGTEL